MKNKQSNHLQLRFLKFTLKQLLLTFTNVQNVHRNVLKLQIMEQADIKNIEKLMF